MRYPIVAALVAIATLAVGTKAQATCFDTLGGLNTVMQTELIRIENGASAQPSYSYNLCANTFLDASMVTLRPVLNNVMFICGDDGGRQNGCVIVGGTEQVRISDSEVTGYPIQAMTFIGITFSSFQSNDQNTGTSITAAASSTTTATFIDCQWQSFSSDFVILQSTTGNFFGPMTVEIERGALSSGTAGSVFSNDGGLLRIAEIDVAGVSAAALISTANNGASFLEKSFISRSDISSITYTTAGGSQTVLDTTVTEMNRLEDGFYVEDIGSTLLLQGVKIEQNRAQTTEWSAVSVRTNSIARMTDTSISDNRALEFGVVVFDSSVTIADSLISRNTGIELSSSTSAPIFAITDSTVNIERVEMNDNTEFSGLIMGLIRSTIRLTKSCIQGGSSDFVIFIANDAEYETSENYIENFTSQSCQSTGPRLFQEFDSSGCFAGSSRCEGSCIVAADQATCRAQEVPTMAPTVLPTSNPTSEPVVVETTAPTVAPTTLNPVVETGAPTFPPVISPTKSPTTRPTPMLGNPTTAPTNTPTRRPTPLPGNPTTAPTNTPTRRPTPLPGNPTKVPSTSAPSSLTQSSNAPTRKPTRRPTPLPGNPTQAPFTGVPTSMTGSPIAPTSFPTRHPTPLPGNPTQAPSTRVPTSMTENPIAPTSIPTRRPTPLPGNPTQAPSTRVPTSLTENPNVSTNNPTGRPTPLPGNPTQAPSTSVSTTLTGSPTRRPTLEDPSTSVPTPLRGNPTTAPSIAEPASRAPDFLSTTSPTGLPTPLPGNPTRAPNTFFPTAEATTVTPVVPPTGLPTPLIGNPTLIPTTQLPEIIPTETPTSQPTILPTPLPGNPTIGPTTATPTTEVQPTEIPLALPTASPSTEPPSETPTQRPTTATPSRPPTESPAPTTTFAPSENPSVSPQPTFTARPSAFPTDSPILFETVQPSPKPMDGAKGSSKSNVSKGKGKGGKMNKGIMASKSSSKLDSSKSSKKKSSRSDMGKASPSESSKSQSSSETTPAKTPTNPGKGKGKGNRGKKARKGKWGRNRIQSFNRTNDDADELPANPRSQGVDIAVNETSIDVKVTGLESPVPEKDESKTRFKAINEDGMWVVSRDASDSGSADEIVRRRKDDASADSADFVEKDKPRQEATSDKSTISDDETATKSDSRYEEEHEENPGVEIVMDEDERGVDVKLTLGDNEGNGYQSTGLHLSVDDEVSAVDVKRLDSDDSEDDESTDRSVGVEIVMDEDELGVDVKLIDKEPVGSRDDGYRLTGLHIAVDEDEPDMDVKSIDRDSGADIVVDEDGLGVDVRLADRRLLSKLRKTPWR